MFFLLSILMWPFPFLIVRENFAAEDLSSIVMDDDETIIDDDDVVSSLKQNTPLMVLGDKDR